MRLFFSLVLCLGMINGYCGEREFSLIDLPGDANEQVDLMIQTPENANAPLLLFLNGASAKGIGGGFPDNWCDYWIEKGYAIAAISLPGYGNSSGRRDFCGPRTMRALNFAIRQIKKKVGVADFGIIGFGQGGLAGTLVAAKRKDVRCLVSANCGYDLLKHQHDNSLLMKTLIEKHYDIHINDSEALKIRSPLHQAFRIETPIFILHREKHPLISIGEVMEFAELLQDSGKECILRIRKKIPGVDHQRISYEEVLLEAEEWVDAHMLP